MMNMMPILIKEDLIERKKAEITRQKAEGRRQKAEGRRQKAEGRKLFLKSINYETSNLTNLSSLFFVATLTYYSAFLKDRKSVV